MLDDKGTVWAKDIPYQALNLILSIGDQGSIDGWFPIYKTKFGTVPPLREIRIRKTSGARCLGVTVDNHIYCFFDGQTHQLESEVVSLHIVSSIEYLALLKNGRLRILFLEKIDGKYRLNINNSEGVDANINHPIVSLSKVSSHHRWLAVTSENRYLIVEYRVESYKNPLITLRISDELKIILDHREILMTKDRSILTVTGKIYSIVNYNSRQCAVKEYELADVVDVLQLTTGLVLLTKPEQLYLLINKIVLINIDLGDIEIERFISYQRLSTATPILYLHPDHEVITFQSTTGEIHTIDSCKRVQKIDIPRALIKN